MLSSGQLPNRFQAHAPRGTTACKMAYLVSESVAPTPLWKQVRRGCECLATSARSALSGQERRAPAAWHTNRAACFAAPPWKRRPDRRVILPASPCAAPDVSSAPWCERRPTIVCPGPTRCKGSLGISEKIDHDGLRSANYAHLCETELPNDVHGLLRILQSPKTEIAVRAISYPVILTNRTNV
ncbi:hypothetical protein HRbin36_00542 [bacterium HR36]|nr:hypothetical protein HRbin36_00542 [bacterium HR36]